MPTIGVEFLTQEINLPGLPPMKASIWDTSGNERYRCITTGHYRKAVGALLVCDITERSSFESLDYWLSEIKSKAHPSIEICLMANKCDMAE